ncbi:MULTISPECIES: type 1 glutamine amidotransferase domain-containing protein [Sphingomonadaceae]|uniref:Protease n=1 Tax=Sphingomonas bisphenolicum TaxID=296544 RepID=A0ABN5WCG8_9SPHN|nr:MULTISPECIES: type 1 glutamine amidotransferase domain-containing protein [Sphingomonadaceae]MBA4090331.1 peptidase C56 [Sphingobium sp.]MBZ9647424.1 type 1 glutamine amidotransferase [Sphingobium sp. 3R8]BBF68090.1 protease [Sphingomonas bisphenolicum]
MPVIEESRILILATDGFEQSELFEPRQALLDAGAEVVLASPGTKPIQGMKHAEKGDRITPDITLEAVRIAEYDGLILPGGVANPDTLRMNEKAVAIVRAFAESGKPVAAICHGPWLLVEAGVASGRTMTSWPSLRTDLANAGAQVVDMQVAIDGNIITSRNPDDIPAFVEAFRTAVSAGQPVEA